MSVKTRDAGSQKINTANIFRPDNGHVHRTCFLTEVRSQKTEDQVLKTVHRARNICLEQEQKKEILFNNHNTNK